jgi:hypothetical protein
MVASSSASPLALDGVVYSFPTEQQADRTALAWIDRSVIVGCAVYVYEAVDGSFTISTVLASVEGLNLVGRWTSAGFRSYREQTVFVRVR